MAVVGIEIRRRGLFAGGQAFGEGGQYERIDGVMRFALDPTHPANQAIVDLGYAERDRDGRVAFEADMHLLRPRDDARSNRRLLFHVANRGRIGAVPFSGASTPEVPSDEVDPGDGFLMRRGWSVLAVGWQWDVIRRAGFIGLEAPMALADGRPIQGQVLVQFQPNETRHTQRLAHWANDPAPTNPNLHHRPYPAADLDDPSATLTVRDWLDGPATTIARGAWRFAREADGAPIADDSHVWLDGGFQAGKLYQLSYRTRICPIVGVGLAAVRDAVSFARYGATGVDNPLAGIVDHTFGWGVSQCGRFLREFLYQGMNLDEDGRLVFDGVIPLVAGARRGEFNHRFAQPSAQHARGYGHAPPFATEEQIDPITGQRDGLLARQRALGGVPKVFLANTSSEYWRIDASLLHTDLTGTTDIEPPEDVRIYLFGGTQHGVGKLPPSRATTYGANTANLLNTVDYLPLLRALLVNLEGWVVDGIEPPASVFPRLADGTAVTRESVLERFAAIPGVALLDPALLPRLPRIDLGPDAADGIGRFPPPAGEVFPCFVSTVDDDLNEVAAIRLPDLSVPLGSHTGWNPRDPATGGVGQLVDMQGSTLPFAGTAGERRRLSDPRPAIAERYPDRKDYLARVRGAADDLVRRRYVLADDVDLVVALAAARYDTFAPVADLVRG